MSANPSEATQTEKPVTKHQTQELTDLTSFNAYAFVTLSDGQSVGVQLTGRHGIPAERMYNDFQEFAKFLDMCAVDHAVKFVNKRNGEYGGEANAKPDKPDNGSTPASNNGGNGGEKPKRNYKDPIPQAELPEELVETNENVYAAEFDYFVVKPDLDGKSVVQFFKDNLEFAVGGAMNKWKHDTIKQALVKLTDKEIDPTKAEKYRIAGTQYFVLGNEYIVQKGKSAGQKSRYKNIVLLKPIFQAF